MQLMGANIAAVNRAVGQQLLSESSRCDSPQFSSFSWIRSGRLAIGSFPRSPGHWQLLAAQGIGRVFCCCSAAEGHWQPPTDWPAEQLALPDYRHPGTLTPPLLAEAIARVTRLYQQPAAPEAGGLYLHCWAGQQRSPLLATALLHQSEGISLWEALAQVRRLHPASRPINSQLAVLEELLA